MGGNRNRRGNDMKFRVAMLALMATALSTSAFANPAMDLWSQGKYEDAIKQGLAENSPEGTALAARAAVSDMTAHTTPCAECINRAIDLSRKALAADPKAPIPTLCLAAALSYRGHLIGMMAAQNEKLGEISKQSIDDAIAAHPKDPQLLAALGGWNFEVVRQGGSLLARWTYGATIDKGLQAYSEALKLAPNDILVNYQYGLELAAYDPDEYRDKVEAAWKRVEAAPSTGAYDDMEKKRAGELLALLNDSDKTALKTKLNAYMGIPE
jgi:hypothetical protein